MKQFFTIIFIFASLAVAAQVTISGVLTDTKGKPIKAASIVIIDSYDGTTTDSLGRFSFITSEVGERNLSATMSGYATYKNKIVIGNTNQIINISIKEFITELNAVVITAGSFEASDKVKGSVLTSLDIVTTAGSNGDITAAFKTLPGTQQVGDAEGLFVRGGSATESKIYIDGTLVNNFFYSSLPGVATRGRFNPFLFKGTVFSAGGYSALYGQALSAALILESQDLPDRTQADLNLSAIGIGGGIQSLSKNKKSSWGITYNYADLSLAFAVLPVQIDFFKTPKTHQVDANFRVKTKKGGFFKYYGYISTNTTGIRNTDIDSLQLKNAFTVKNLNTFQNISYKKNLGKGYKINTAASFSTNKDDINNELQDANNAKQQIFLPAGYATKNFLVATHATYAQARVVIDKRLKGINTLRLGSDYFYSNEKSTFTLFNGTKFKDTITDNLNAFFTEIDFYVTKDIAIKLGTRLEHTTLLKKWNIAPRASIAYKVNELSQVSFAYGIFYQNPERRQLPTTNPSLGFAKAAHYVLQWQRVSKIGLFRTELYYKQYHNLYKTAPNTFGTAVAANNNGTGYAKGFELFWRDKKTIKDLDYWVSYSYLDTKRNYLNFPTAITPNFAANHTASVVAKKFITKWKTGFNASYSIASGRPFYNIALDNSTNKFAIKEQGKTINFNSLSLSANYLPNLGKQGKKTFSVVVLSVSNVLGQKQIFGYNFSSINDNKVAITQPYKQFVFVGWFLSFGVDRTQDVINGNL